MLLSLTAKKFSSRLKARISVSTFFFISGYTFSSWASRIPSMQEQFHLNNAELGTVLFVMPMGLIITLPFTGTMLSRISSRYLMLAGALLYAILLPLLPVTNAVWQLGIILFIFGSSRNFLNISANAQSIGVQGLYDKFIVASFHGIWSLAGFAGAAIGSFMITHNISPFIHFLIVGSTTLLLIILTFGDTIKEDIPSDKKKSLIVLPDKALVKLGAVAFCSMSCEGTMYDWSSIYFQKEVHAAPSQVGLGFVAYMGTMTSARFVGGWLIKTFGEKKLLQLSGCLIAAGLITAIVFPNIVTAIIGFMLAGLGVSCVVPIIFTLAGKNSKLPPGAAIAAVSIVGYGGFLLGPPIIGHIAQAFNLRWSFLLIACMGLMIPLLVKKVRIKESE